MRQLITSVLAFGDAFSVVMKRMTQAIAFVCTFSLCGESQVPATSHTFPLFVDSFDFGSTLLVTNVNVESVTCTSRVSSAAPNWTLPGTFTLPAEGSFRFFATESHNPLAIGYVTLQCNRPVIASTGYFLGSPTGGPGTGTVFSSPVGSRGQLNIDPRYRLGIAIANDTDSAAVYKVGLVNRSGQTTATTGVPVPARSNITRFADELIGIPNDTALLTVTAPPGSSFSMIGLTFNGPVFWVWPAIMF